MARRKRYSGSSPSAGDHAQGAVSAVAETGVVFASPFHGIGTKFKLFPQPPVLPAFTEPETVWIALPPEQIAPGPSDDRLYVIDPINKTKPYDFPYLPPYQGPAHPPVEAAPDGHFDHLQPGTREFNAAHMYGAVRFVLDIWEDYFDCPIEWHFQDDMDRLELVPWIDWNNAHAGYGFIETGYRRSETGEPTPLSLNFDVLAHEFGHSILYSVLGVPPAGAVTAEYLAFHESASDLVALIAALHFDSVVDLVLSRTKGNLYLTNILNRIGELSPTDEIRVASNSLRMCDVASTATPLEQLSYPALHELGQPLTGAIFDILVEIYQNDLVAKGLITEELDEACFRGPVGERQFEEIQNRFGQAYADKHDAFKQSLLEVRDYMGIALAATWKHLSWDLTFVQAGNALMRVDQELSGGMHLDIIRSSFLWRQIRSVPFRRRASFREQMMIARQGRI